MRAQCLGRLIVAGQFDFGKGCVNFTVANMVHQNGWTAFPALKFRDQVMSALGDVRRDWAPA